ncbi:hypothetical protein BGZ60DRAFT_531317 [Tricladium varicosporioides]|nr:hypothetical protein BGZ60DRAFT_531317 [Hymenoscyphus varicosporioides]
MAAPNKKFSWTRLITNAIPNFANDANTSQDINLSPAHADLLFTYQQTLSYPRYLGENAFFITGIVGAESVSLKVWKGLVKNGIILPSPESGKGGGNPVKGEQVTVNTRNITSNFANQHATISVHAQRKVVGLLFFWEEECVRLSLLDSEEEEILAAVREREGVGRGQVEGEGGESGGRDLEVALESVRIRRGLVPSKRAEDTANVGVGRGHELPGYVR